MINEIRAKLKEAHSQFVSLYGFLNSPRNIRVILKDDMGYRICASVERKDGQDWVASDMLTRANKHEIEPYKGDDPREAVMYSLGMFGKVDMTWICATCDKEQHEVLMELGDMVYWNPIEEIWETADRWLAGNVYLKMTECERLCTGSDCHQEIQRSLAAIREIQPDKIPFELLDFNLGERWITCEQYTEFANWLFETGADVTVMRSE